MQPPDVSVAALCMPATVISSLPGLLPEFRELQSTLLPYMDGIALAGGFPSKHKPALLTAGLQSEGFNTFHHPQSRMKLACACGGLTRHLLPPRN